MFLLRIYINYLAKKNFLLRFLFTKLLSKNRIFYLAFIFFYLALKYVPYFYFLRYQYMPKNIDTFLCVGEDLHTQRI